MELGDSMVYRAGGFPGHPSGIHITESEAKRTKVRQPRVLVVDDERLLADTTAAVLGRAGFDVKIAYDGFGALEMMGFFRPDFLLTDIMMPSMNGVELAIAITKMYPATKILLISGQAGITDLLEEHKANGFEFPVLAKPIHPTRLVERLTNLMDR